jgi:hypothetical protein
VYLRSFGEKIPNSIGELVDNAYRIPVVNTFWKSPKKIGDPSGPFPSMSRCFHRLREEEKSLRTAFQPLGTRRATGSIGHHVSASIKHFG